NDLKRKIELDHIEEELDSLNRYVKKLEPEFKGDLVDTIHKQLSETCKRLLNEYVEELKKIVSDVPVGEMDVVKLDPMTMIEGSIVPEKFSVDNLIKTEQIKDGEEWIENTNKKWYKPWTWFQEKGYYR